MALTNVFKQYWSGKITGPQGAQPGLTADSGSFTNVTDGAAITGMTTIASTNLSFSLVGSGGLGITGTLNPGIYKVKFSFTDNSTWVPPSSGSIGGRWWRIASCSGSGLCSVSGATYSPAKGVQFYFNQSTGGSLGPDSAVVVEGDFIISTAGTYTFNLQKSNIQALNGGSIELDLQGNLVQVSVESIL